jgi:hypothetical protein
MTKFEPGTEAFHERMRAHWQAALEAHRREIESEGTNLSRRLSLERLESLVRDNEPDVEPRRNEHAKVVMPEERELWDQYTEAVRLYWRVMDRIPPWDLETWAAVPFPARPELPDAQPRKRKKKSDDEPLEIHCPNCGMRWFRCACAIRPKKAPKRRERKCVPKPEVIAACGLYSCGGCYVVGLDEDSDPVLVHPPRSGFDQAYLLGLDRASGLVPPAPPKPKAPGGPCRHCQGTRQCSCITCLEGKPIDQLLAPCSMCRDAQ